MDRIRSADIDVKAATRPGENSREKYILKVLSVRHKTIATCSRQVRTINCQSISARFTASLPAAGGRRPEIRSGSGKTSPYPEGRLRRCAAERGSWINGEQLCDGQLPFRWTRRSAARVASNTYRARPARTSTHSRTSAGRAIATLPRRRDSSDRTRLSIRVDWSAK